MLNNKLFPTTQELSQAAPPAIERRQQQSEFVCSACGADRGCGCNAPALTRIEKRGIIAGSLKENPEKSDREIGRTVKVDHKTRGADRAEQEARGEIPHVEARTDTKGRKQPAKKKSKKEQQRSFKERCELRDKLGLEAMEMFPDLGLMLDKAGPHGSKERAE